MLSRKYGKIINISSGLGGAEGCSGTVYSACKANLSASPSQWPPKSRQGINVNSVTWTPNQLPRDKDGRMQES
jgi:short-subunit dehydrogenase